MKNLLSLCALFISIITTANNEIGVIEKSGIISGKIIDFETKEALPYVNIVITDSNGEILTGGITNINGKFVIKNIPLGENTVEIQFMGYKTVRKKIHFSSLEFKYDLETIAISESADQLDEVVVVAEVSTVVQKIDRRVINVGKDLIAAGTTASELLNNVQSVSVDSQSGNISLRGNENVRILIDGKPTNVSAAQLMQQIPSASIKQIELITNPSAKYNPEGMSGIINIVLHKSANQGFNGSVNTGITQGKYTRYNGSLDLNYKTGIVNFFMNYGYTDGKSKSLGNVNRLDDNSHQEFDFTKDPISHILKTGADIYINKKNTFSFYTTQNWYDNISNGTTKIYENNNLIIDSYNAAINDTKNSSYNFDYKIDFEKEGHNLEFESTFTKYNGPESSINGDVIDPSDNFNNYTTVVGNRRKGGLYNLDYANPLSDISKLELGLEVRTGVSENEQTTTQYEYILDDNGNQIPDPSNPGEFLTQLTPDSNFEYHRDIYSGYANYNHKFNKVTMQLGARLEQYEIDGTFVKGTETEKVIDEIFSVYPSAFFTFNPSEINQFQLSFSRRVDRPSISQINPIRQWSTPRITKVGNPNLRPQFTNSYEFNYTRQLEKGSLTFGTFYRAVNDNITRIINIDPLDVDKVLMSFTNTDKSNRYGFEASASYKIAKWWRANASADLYYQEQSGVANNKELEVTNSSFNARLSNSFTATEKLRFQLFSMFRGGSKSLQSEIDPMWMINIGSSYNVLKGKGTFTFRVNDIFNGMKFGFEGENPYPSTGEFKWESRTAFLGFNYRFGGGKNKAKTRKTRDNNEAQSNGGFM